MTDLKEGMFAEEQFNGVPAMGRAGHAHRGSVPRSNASQRPVLRAIGEDPVQIWYRYRIIPCTRICSPPAACDISRFFFAR